MPRFTCGLTVLLALTAAVWGSDQDLVDALVSKNKPTTGEWNEKLPDSWDAADEQRVQAAYDVLVARGKSIVPALIANWERPEFSMTMSTSVPYRPVSVGWTCKMLVEQLYDRVGMRYKSRSLGSAHLVGTTYFSSLQTREQVSVWWSLAKDLDVPTVQLKIREWYITRETDFGFTDDQQRNFLLNEIDECFKR